MYSDIYIIYVPVGPTTHCSNSLSVDEAQSMVCQALFQQPRKASCRWGQLLRHLVPTPARQVAPRAPRALREPSLCRFGTSRGALPPWGGARL